MARPKSEEARQAAIDAAVELLVEDGVDGVTFEEVAARSGVAKTTLYRHFGTKAALVVAAAASCFVELPTPDTGDLETDLRLIFDQWKATDEKHRVPDLMPTLLAASDRDDDLRQLVTAMIEDRSRPIRTVLRLAQMRGQIDPDLDLDLALALLKGPFVQRRMVDRLEVTDEFRDGVLRNVVAGLLATGRRAAT
jgi:AcrR family transcriptional regulator